MLRLLLHQIMLNILIRLRILRLVLIKPLCVVTDVLPQRQDAVIRSVPARKRAKEQLFPLLRHDLDRIRKQAQRVLLSQLLDVGQRNDLLWNLKELLISPSTLE